MRRLVTVLAVTLLVAVPMLVASAGASEPEGTPRKDNGVALSSGELRAAVAALEAGGEAGIEVVGGRIVVEVHYDGPEAAARALVAEAGGEVNGYVAGRLLQALIPFDRLEWLEAQPGIEFLRRPLEAVPEYLPPAPPAESYVQPRTAVTGEEVAESNADAWHAAGYTGAGVRVGIVDSFDQEAWTAAQANGDLPAPSGTFCRNTGATCDIWASNSYHGEGVAEIVHEMAPDADIYIAHAVTVADLQAAVDWFDTQGVDVISRSLTARYDGPGDGTGPLADVIDDAVSKGMFWANSAGNNAGPSSGQGSYWRGEWNDPDGNGYMNFYDTGFGWVDEYLAFDCAYINGLRWSDWDSSNPSDYDIYIYEFVNPTNRGALLDSGIDSQGSGWSNDPVENPTNCNDGDVLQIKLYAANDGTSGDILEFMINGTEIAISQNEYTASGPASDTSNWGAVSVGAIDPATGNTIASYSSRGPTNDARTKPDLSAQACVKSFTYSPTGLANRSCFNGTSAATPVVAGAAALVLGTYVADYPAELKAWLLDYAVVDRGPAGDDDTYGTGELLLPAPPPDVYCAGFRPSIWGTDDPETIEGTSGTDVIVGLGGGDLIYGKGGTDWVCAGAGADTVYGGNGPDRIYGEKGSDFLDGGPGNDLLVGERGIDTITPGTGTDTVIGGVDSDWVVYSDAGSGVTVDLSRGTVRGGDDDTLHGIENVTGSVYNDRLIGSKLANTLWGNDGDDKLFGKGGDDVLSGQDGNDILHGLGGADDLYGGAGNDSVVPGDGTDTADGGGGVDRVIYAQAPSAVEVRLALGTVTGGSGGDAITGFENLVGSKFADRLYGSSVRNVIWGRGGDDFINGLKGNDVLYGQGGNDIAIGHDGNDRCVAETTRFCEL